MANIKKEIKSKDHIKNNQKMIDIVSKKINKHFCELRKKGSAFEALYVFGVVGWGIGIPVVISSYIGIWLEENHPIEYLSWTLYFVIIGFLAGFYNVYRWVRREQKRLDREDKICE